MFDVDCDVLALSAFRDEDAWDMPPLLWGIVSWASNEPVVGIDACSRGNALSVHIYLQHQLISS